MPKFLILFVSLLFFHTVTGNLRWRREILGESREDPRSNRSLTIIRSQSSSPKWMITVGGSQEELDFLHFSRQKFRPKSIQMDFSSNEDVPIPIILYDQLENLDGMVSVSKMDYWQLKQKLLERAQLGHILVEAYASETPQGDLMITSVWSENQALISDILMVTDAGGLSDRSEVEQKLMAGFLPVSICGFQRQGASVSHYLMVFVRPVNLSKVYHSMARVKIGQNLNNCLQQDRILNRQGLTAQRLHVHLSNRGQLKCAVIYWTMPNGVHLVNKGSDLQLLYNQVSMRKRGREFAPKSVSRIILEGGKEEFIVLWNSAPIWALPPPIALRNPGQFGCIGIFRPTPFQYVPGVNVELPTQLLSFLNGRIIEFMQRFDLPGFTIAIAKNERLKLAAGFGYANLKTEEQMTPTHKFRIGSISKVITATAIGVLADENQLGFDEKVFGEGSIFGYDFASNGYYHPFVEQITVRHLMAHTVGAWPNMGEDPVFKNELQSPKELIAFTIRNDPPKEMPGHTFLYSNFGYLILGEIIEKRSGLSYVEFVNQRLFEPIGIQRQFLINTKMDLGQNNGILYYPTPEMSDDPYDLPTASILAACCGWEMTPTNVLKFLTHADGFPSQPDIISPDIFNILGTVTKESNYTYAMGWGINESGLFGRTHQGQMPSALSLLVRTDSGVEIVLATNRFPPRMIAMAEMSYLAHHLISMFEGPETDNFDHFT